VLEAEFILLEPLSPPRRIFIGSHSLPPLWFAVSVLQSTTDEVGDRYDDNMDLSLYVQMTVPVHPPKRTRRDPPLVNFMKEGTNMRTLHFWPEDPRRLQRSFFSDDRFWLAHQADRYE
jgi:hypothetical protein